MLSQELTRTIYWSPTGSLNLILHKSSYFFLLLACLIFAFGLWRHIKLWRLGQPEVVFNKPITRIILFFKNVLAQSRVLKARRQRDINLLSAENSESAGLHAKFKTQKQSYYSAIMHGTIFYGFLILSFATFIVALKDYHIIDIYHGYFYAFIKILCQLGGLGLAFGLLMGVFRRKQKALQFPSSLDYNSLYFILFLLVLEGFILQGFRIAFQVKAPDAQWAFIGLLFSYLFPHNITPSIANYFYTGLWYFHMLTTMVFIAIIPYTRALHIVTSCLNLYTQRLEPNVTLDSMDFENTNVEYYGVRELRDFSWKDLLSFDSCTECRRCTDVCPANIVHKPLDPREIILKMRDNMRAENVFSFKVTHEDRYFYESGLISNAEVWACTNCGACVNDCPVGIDPLRIIMQLRRYQALTLGEIPHSAGKSIENIKHYGNPWGLAQNDRFKWADGLDLPIISESSPEVEYLYYIGCAGSYDNDNQKVTLAVVNILKMAKVSFAVMGKSEKCTGEPLRRLGDEYSFSEMARTNVEHLNQLKFKKIITHCPHCYNTLKNDYTQFGGHYEVFHHSQLLAELHQHGRLSLPNSVHKDVTFHDPCFLGRHNGEFEAPRRLLEAVAGLRLIEMEKNRKNASCCGMGGGNMWYESEGGSLIIENRLKHVADTGAKTLVTACSYCMINFKSAFANLAETKDLEVLDLAEAINLAMAPKQAERILK